MFQSADTSIKPWILPIMVIKNQLFRFIQVVGSGDKIFGIFSQCQDYSVFTMQAFWV